MPNIYKLNCNDLVCPLPVAKTKRRLREMKPSETLEVIGDFGESGENIIVFCKSQGYIILESHIEKDKYSIKIKKP